MLPAIVPLLRDLVNNETRIFRDAIELPDALRNRVLANHHRETMMLLHIIRAITDPPPRPRLIPRANFTIDLTQDLLRSFHEPVAVVPTPAQIAAAMELNATPPLEGLCAICQETMTTSARLSRCNHHFHQACITQWFGSSVRCPVCRNDIRGEEEEEE